MGTRDSLHTVTRSIGIYQTPKHEGHPFWKRNQPIHRFHISHRFLPSPYDTAGYTHQPSPPPRSQCPSSLQLIPPNQITTPRSSFWTPQTKQTGLITQKINASNIQFNAFELSHQADCDLFHASNYLFEAHNQHQQTSNYYRQA